MPDTARIYHYSESLFRVALPVPLPGFDGFISSWVHTANPTAIIDPGPDAAQPDLLSALSELGIRTLDLILLTHIHIDHAGGIGSLAAQFPDVPVVCHPKAVEHLADPERLWQGSLKTLGDVARAYGSIKPVAASQLLGSDRFEHDAVAVVNTPGHAVHHISYLVGDNLFVGEACGVNLPVDKGLYLRPATPPRFFLETFIQSLDALIEMKPSHLCYGHVGRRDGAMALMHAHREQLLRWKTIVEPYALGADKGDDQAIQACIDTLIQSDPLLASFTDLPAIIQQRERGFLKNSVLGYWGYLENRG